jgi:hypothetical protein
MSNPCGTTLERAATHSMWDILQNHWIEENQHTKTDVLEIEQLARVMSPDELSTAFDHIQGLGGLVDETFVGQVEQELATFQSVMGRRLASQKRWLCVRRCPSRCAPSGPRWP